MRIWPVDSQDRLKRQCSSGISHTPPTALVGREDQLPVQSTEVTHLPWWHWRFGADGLRFAVRIERNLVVDGISHCCDRRWLIG